MLDDRESHLRSIAKGLTWLILATFTTAPIACFVTGSIKPALANGGVEFFLKFMVFYGHERAWETVPHGSFRKLESKLFKQRNKAERKQAMDVQNSAEATNDCDLLDDEVTCIEPSTINNWQLFFSPLFIHYPSLNKISHVRL